MLFFLYGFSIPLGFSTFMTRVLKIYELFVNVKRGKGSTQITAINDGITGLDLRKTGEKQRREYVDAAKESGRKRISDPAVHYGPAGKLDRCAGRAGRRTGSGCGRSLKVPRRWGNPAAAAVFCKEKRKKLRWMGKFWEICETPLRFCFSMDFFVQLVIISLYLLNGEQGSCAPRFLLRKEVYI